MDIMLEMKRDVAEDIECAISNHIKDMTLRQKDQTIYMLARFITEYCNVSDQKEILKHIEVVERWKSLLVTG